MEALSIPLLAMKIPTEAAAYEFLEIMRWNGRPVCPHCGSVDGTNFIKPRNGVSRETTRGKQSERRLWACKSCRKQYSVLTGTIFHGTKIPVRTWLFVIFEMVSSKNGLAAREVQRKYKLSPKSAWFLTQRIREAMKREPFASALQGTIIADEAWIGGIPKYKHRDEFTYEDSGRRVPKKEKTAIVALIHKETGEVRSQVVARVTHENLGAVLDQHIDKKNSVLHTDNAKIYRAFSWQFLNHESVNHSAGEYVRGDVTTNHVEGYFGQLKRSINGTHHHVSEEHLPRYLAEFDFRYNTCDETDTARMEKLVSRVAGRRLTYRPLNEE